MDPDWIILESPKSEEFQNIVSDDLLPNDQTSDPLPIPDQPKSPPITAQPQPQNKIQVDLSQPKTPNLLKCCLFRKESQ